MATGNGKKPMAWSFATRNYVVPVYTAGWTANDGTYAREEAGTGWFPSFKVRLFRNDRRIRFTNPVHELVEPSLRAIGIPIRESPVPVHHYGKLDQGKDLAKGEAYYELGKKKLAEHGDSLEALRELAIQAGGLKKHAEAVSLWQRVLCLSPELAIAHLNLGTAYIELNRFVDALESSERALAAAPTMKEAAYNCGLCLLYAGQAARAVATLEELTRREPQYPSARVLLALAHCCNGQTEAGMQLLRLFRKLDFGFVDSLVKLTTKLMAAGRHGYAAALLQAATDSDNVNEELLHLREELERRQSARESRATRASCATQRPS